MGPELLAQLVDAQGAGLVLYARQWCAAPEDIVQEAFLKLIAQRTVPDNPTAWLYRVVRNTAISANRALRRRQQHESAAAAGAPSWFLPEMGAGIDGEAATRAIQALPAEQRECVVAHLWGGLTFEEIADLAGCSASTAHRWYSSGLSALRERLGVPWPTHSAVRS
jgi:RNA polymerase sigma factor (sigma-70 family)